jgi:hypothetical protein
MDDKLNAAVEVLLGQLDAVNNQAFGIKTTINGLMKSMGKPPMFQDVEIEQRPTMQIRKDEFYGKPLATAAAEYLQRRKEALPIEDILAALEQGGFDFRTVDWQKDDRLRSLSISLAKNTKVFHRLPSKAFGLTSWYDLKKAARAPAEPAAEAEEGKAQNA